jgi:hypothetical protein
MCLRPNDMADDQAVGCLLQVEGMSEASALLTRVLPAAPTEMTTRLRQAHTALILRKGRSVSVVG